MRIENVKIDYHVDQTGKAVHILEINKSYDGLANKVDSSFKMKLINEKNLSSDTFEYDWILYCYNGLILTLSGYNLYVTPKIEKRLYRPFLDGIKPRIV
jgi:hypothetical protein